MDNAGDLFIADLDNRRVREVTLSTGVITTAAGNGTAGYDGDGGQATATNSTQPSAIAVDDAGDLFIVDSGDNGRNGCRRELPRSPATEPTDRGDGGPATAAGLDYRSALRWTPRGTCSSPITGKQQDTRSKPR